MAPGGEELRPKVLSLFATIREILRFRMKAASLDLAVNGEVCALPVVKACAQG